jgi:thiol-disulfide isomerase/thioredoxin
MKQLLFIFSWLLLGSTFLSAAPMKNNIKLHFPGAENRQVRVWTFTDLFSLNLVDVAEGKFSSSGEFSFVFNPQNIRSVFIEVGYFQNTFLVEPGKTYTIEYEKVDFNQRKYYPTESIAFLSPEIKIIASGNGEINAELDSLFAINDRFYALHQRAILSKSLPPSALDSLQEQLKKFTEIYPSPYLKTEVDVQLMQLRLMINQYGRSYVARNFFKEVSKNLDNESYIAFFRSFWSHYLPNELPVKQRNKLDSVINKVQSYSALMALLSEDPNLSDSNLRELVILRNLEQLAHNPRFSSDALDLLLQDMSKGKVNKKHVLLAVNMRKKIDALQSGHKAPDFQFQSIKGDTLDLKHLEGKYVYIQFVNNKCVACQSDMVYTQELYEKLSDIIYFVHISTDMRLYDFQQLIENKGYKWNFVFLDNPAKFVENYHVGALPRAILIDPQGNLVDLDAALPTEQFEEKFLKMLNDKKGNLRPKYQMLNGKRE